MAKQSVSGAFQIARQLLDVLADEKPELVPLVAELLPRLNPCRHGSDFAAILWFGKRYSFTVSQGAVVKALWEAWELGIYDVRQETLLLAADSESGRLLDIFRDHDSWGVLIVPGTARGTFRLTEPGK